MYIIRPNKKRQSPSRRAEDNLGKQRKKDPKNVDWRRKRYNRKEHKRGDRLGTDRQRSVGYQDGTDSVVAGETDRRLIHRDFSTI